MTYAESQARIRQARKPKYVVEATDACGEQALTMIQTWKELQLVLDEALDAEPVRINVFRVQ